MSLTHSHIVTLGPEGTFSDLAAQMIRDKEATIEYGRTFPETLSVLDERDNALAVMPIENSVAGIVEQVQDLILERNLAIVAEINIPVRYALLGCGTARDTARFYAHPQAHGQTLNYMTRRYPDCVVEFTNSNIESGNLFLEAKTRGQPAMAIVPVTFGNQHPDDILDSDIQDYPNNTTRFVAIRPKPANFRPDLSRQKSSVYIEFNEDRSGLLFELLSIFQRHGINLSRLESRPSKTTPWFYVFYVDFTNNENSAACIDELEGSPFKCSILGSYDEVKA